MIHYHGGPIYPVTAAFRLWRARHAFVSFAYPEQVEIAAEEAQSFALDNGAFSAWKSRDRKVNWQGMDYDWGWPVVVASAGYDFAS